MSKTKLYAPTGSEIVGLLASDESLQEFEFSYDAERAIAIYEIKGSGACSQNPVVLVDARGEKWDSSTVEWYSLVEMHLKK